MWLIWSFILFNNIHKFKKNVLELNWKKKLFFSTEIVVTIIRNSGGYSGKGVAMIVETQYQIV